MKRLLTGITIIVLGFVLLLASLNIDGVQATLGSWWPLFIILFGLIQLTDRQPGNWWPFIVVLIGAILLVQSVTDVPIDIWRTFWPVVIIVVGASIVAGGRFKFAHEHQANGGEIVAVLSGVTTKDVSEDFQGNHVTTILGGAEVNLAKATIKKEATITVSVVMGGIELRVPEEVIVKSRAICIMGGVEDKTGPVVTKNAPVLYLEGTIFMGGVEIKR